MYETFYRLTATPFRLTPDPEFSFSHAGYAEARAYLQYAFTLGEGLIILTGRPGAGKTTLIESFLKELEANKVATARIAPANLETTDLLRSVAFVYGIQVAGLDKATLLRRISQYFSTLMHHGRRVLLVIDEAQGLSHGALEELRLLADLQEGARPLLQIFLVGQERLRSVMREPDMEQLQQRVIGTYRLGPMGLAETRNYIQHRLCRAGWSGDPGLTGAAILAIFRYSGGVPRHINKMCTRLLLYGFMQSQHILDKEDVVCVARELEEENLSPVGNAQSSPAEAEGDAGRVSLQDDSISLSDLEVRASQGTGDALPPSAPPETGKSAAASFSRSGPAPAATHRVAPPRRPQRKDVRPNAAQPRRAVSNAARHSGSTPAARVFPGLRKRQEKPAVLFAMVAAVTVAAAALISYIERHAVEPSSAFVVNSQPLQPGSSATPAGESREAAGPHGARPELREPDVPGVAPAQGVDGQLAGVATHGETGIDVASGVSQHSAPVSTTTVQEPSAAVAGRGDSGSGSAAHPAGHDDEAGARDSAQSVSSVAVESPAVSPPDRLGSDGQTRGAEPARTADSASPAVDTAMTDASGPVDRTVRPATGDPRQPLSSGQAAVSAVSVDERITRLLWLAGEALREDRLMTPAKRSAYSYYQQVLSLEPRNAKAQSGLRRIVERYITLAKRAIQRQDKSEADLYITRALRIRPGDARLLALKNSMNTVSVSTRHEPPAAPPPKSPPRVAEEPRNILQRLRDFFTINLPESREEHLQSPDSRQ